MIENNLSALELAQQYNEAIRQRDELLVALEGMLEVFVDEFDIGDSETVDVARQAVANAQGETK